MARSPTIQPSCGMSRWKVWKSSKEPEPFEDVIEESEGVDEEKEYLRSLEEKEREARAEYIEERRNKSRLSASHRQIVKGEMPYEGSIFHYNSDHMSKEHKRSQMSK